MMKSILVAALALVTPAAVNARWTGNVIIYNLMQNRTLEWIGANATGKGGESCMLVDRQMC